MSLSTRCVSIVTLLACAGAAFAQPVPPQPTPNIPTGTDVFGDAIQGPGAWPAGLSGANFLVGLPANTINGRFGSNALAHNALYSGPYAWSAGNTNEGDIDFVIGVAQPTDIRSFPTWSGWDAFRESDSGIPDPNLPNNTFYSFEYSAAQGGFVIQSRVLDSGNNTWGESYPLRDSNFYFMWIDFTNPATLGGSGPTCEYDFNQDENVDLLDAQQMAQVFVGLLTPEANWLDGDLNGDENADLTDAQLLAAFVVSGNCGL